MKLVLLLLLAWVIKVWMGVLISWIKAARRDRPSRPALHVPCSLPYSLDEARNRMLALAHPMAAARIKSAYATEAAPDPAELRALRTPLLHLFGLRSDISDQQLRQTLPELLRRRWFRLDLDGLQPGDDPRDAMAFACARVAFGVRAAALLGWLDEAAQWQLLAHNARRAADCFDGWQDFGKAWARGRRQWITRSRADSLGLAFDEEQVQRWLADGGHPWARLPWQAPG